MSELNPLPQLSLLPTFHIIYLCPHPTPQFHGKPMYQHFTPSFLLLLFSSDPYCPQFYSKHSNHLSFHPDTVGHTVNRPLVGDFVAFSIPPTPTTAL